MKLELTHNNRLLKVLKATTDELNQLSKISTGSGYNRIQKRKWEKTYFHNWTWLPSGYWREILKLTKLKPPYQVDIAGLYTGFFRKIDREEFTDWVMSLGLVDKDGEVLDPYDYQIDAAINALKFNTCRSEIATGGGKTLIAYLICKYTIDHGLLPAGMKLLILVPKVDLVKQTVFAFQTWAQDGSVICDSIFSGGRKFDNSNVVVGNIDSLTNYDGDYFSCFKGVLFDEGHKVNTAGYQQILHAVSKNDLLYVHGLSGTFNNADTIEGKTEEAFLGPILLRKTAKELQQQGAIAQLKITQIKILYDEFISASYYEHKNIGKENGRFLLETKFIRELPQRKRLISALARKLEGNTVMLFKGVAYLLEYVEHLKIICPDKQVFAYYGDTPQDERDLIKKIMETDENVIVCATYATIDTGVSINNIMNLLLAESAKSFIRVRQTIGRGLRLHPKKAFLTLVDIVDVLLKRSNIETGPKVNSMAMHGKSRAAIYKQQQFEYVIKQLECSKLQ